MLTSCQKIFAILFFSAFLNLSWAGELWVNYEEGKRSYLAVEQTELGFKLHHYHQEWGEYPDRVEEKYFKKRELLVSFIRNNFSSYLEVEKLASWPVIAYVGDANDGTENASLWKASNEWSEEWEKRYSEWMQQEVSTDFYHKHNIVTNSSNAVIGLRWIFARMNSLPVANTLTETEDLFGHYSMRKIWKELPVAENWHEDQLFLTALKYVMEMISTRTLVLDGYPVKISREGLAPGAYVLEHEGSFGHARIIAENLYENIHDLPIYTLASTSPRDLKALRREALIDQEWPQRNSKEILRFKWPVFKDDKWQLRADDEHPHYSLEQFDPEIRRSRPSFVNFVLAKIKAEFVPLKLAEIFIPEIAGSINDRVLIVNEGIKYCKLNECKMGTLGHDEWSTFTRDLQFKKRFEDIDKIVAEFHLLVPSLQEQWNDALKQNKIMLFGNLVDFSVVRFLVDNNLFSSSPLDVAKKRWGLSRGDLVTQWMGLANKIFNEREKIINKRETPCTSQECFPTNNLWLELNTYHLDTKLNQLYVVATSYCALVEQGGCNFQKNIPAQAVRTFNKKERPLGEWFMDIPFFHSDPRVNKDRRWGKLPDNAMTRVLPFFNTIKISRNSLALIDEKKIYNVLDGSLITESRDDGRIFLTDDGTAFKVNDGLGELKRLSWSADGVGLWRKIADNERILKTQRERRLQFIEDNGHFYFKKPMGDGQVLFVVKNDAIEIIAKHSGSTSFAQGLVSAAVDSKNLVLFDLERGLKKNLVLADQEIKDVNSLIISSFAYPEVVLEYNDRHNDLYFPLLLNLSTMDWKRLDPHIGDKLKIMWSSALQRRAFVQTSFNEEFPELHAIRWGQDGATESARLGNLLLGTKELGDKIYFINGTGGQWDQSPQKDFMVWDNDDIKSIIAPAETAVRFFSTVGPYFSSPENGILTTFESLKNFRLPRDILEKDSSCDLQINSEQLFSYRFSSTYGNFHCMGGGFFTSREYGSDEIVPDFTLYSWMNNKDLADQRWQNDFSNSRIKSGTLIAIGKNLGLWWQQKN